MSLSHSPRIITNGLVFAYDMQNTQKSWKGAPATNYVSNHTWGGDYAGNVFTQSVTDPSQQYRNLPTSRLRNTSSNFNCYITGGNLNQTLSSTDWTFLCYIRRADKQPIPALLTYLYSFSANAEAATVTALEDGWYRLHRTKSGTSAAATLVGLTGLLQNVDYYISGASLTPTAYPVDRLTTGATRSNTQAILDMTGNSTVTVNNLTYNSDGTLSFLNNSGFSFPSINFADGQTIEIWLKPLEADGARRNPYNQAYAGYGTWTHEPDGSINYYYGDAGGDGSPYIGHTSGFTVGQNEIACVCTTRDLATSWWYKNGVQYNSYNHSFGSLTATPGNITIGNGYAGAYYGNIYAVKLYNRALSAAEVKQNFNALRGRYGI